MQFLTWTTFAALVAASPLSGQASPLGERSMPREAEIALALSAAPPSVTSGASVLVLDKDGYKLARTGSNGFVCLVLRRWGAPTFAPVEIRDAVFKYPQLRAPICYNPVASRTVLPYQEMRASLGIAGKTAEQIAAAISDAYSTGKLPRMEGTGFAYMYSAEQDLGPGAGAWHPHVMIFAPYTDNAALGGNPVGGSYPFVGDDPGTPFAVTIIQVDPALAIKSH
jgi:hypothetical protein